MRAFIALCSTLALGTGASGCSSAAEGAASPSRAVDTNPDSAFVAIVTPNGAAEYVCSGVVVAPRVVLTAGHCFEGGNYDKTGWTFEVVLGANAHDASAIHVALEPHPHPDWLSHRARPDGSDADIAIGLAAEDLRIEPAHWASSPPPSSIVGGAARYAGFGAHTTAAKGHRHIEGAKIAGLRFDAVDITADPSPCHGDSGGPLLVRIGDVETVIGVGHTAQGDGAEGCMIGADYTRTDLHADFIRAF